MVVGHHKISDAVILWWPTTMVTLLPARIYRFFTGKAPHSNW